MGRRIPAKPAAHRPRLALLPWNMERNPAQAVWRISHSVACAPSSSCARAASVRKHLHRDALYGQRCRRRRDQRLASASPSQHGPADESTTHAPTHPPTLRCKLPPAVGALPAPREASEPADCSRGGRAALSRFRNNVSPPGHPVHRPPAARSDQLCPPRRPLLTASKTTPVRPKRPVLPAAARLLSLNHPKSTPRSLPVAPPPLQRFYLT